MWDYLDRLRQKSDRQKEIISFGVSVLITLTIFSLWLSSFQLGPGQLAKVDAEKEEVTTTHAVDLAPLATVKDSLWEIGSLFKNLFQSNIEYTR
ncbi:MAG: hypothetical protein AAB545_02450 [Patescibacteria group bacterium]